MRAEKPQAHLTVTTWLRRPVTKTFLGFEYKSFESQTTHHVLNSGQDILDILTNIDQAGRVIIFFEYTGHGYAYGSGLFVTKSGPGFTTTTLKANSALVQRVFHRYTEIQLQACSTAYGGQTSFAYQLHSLLRDAHIIAYRRSILLMGRFGWSVTECVPIPLYSGTVEFNPPPVPEI